MARKLPGNYYVQKFDGCTRLVDLEVKKVLPSHVRKVAVEIGIPYQAMKNGWRIFQETGGRTVDYRIKTNSGSLHFKPTVVCKYSTNKNLSDKDAGKIIREYMTTDINSRDLCNKYNMSVSQFYSWIRELNISGKLFNKVVLDVTEYAKLNICDVIWYKKKPHTTRKSIKNLTYSQKKAYERVGDVLLNYLP